MAVTQSRADNSAQDHRKVAKANEGESDHALMRTVETPFVIERAVDTGDGMTLEGYASVFNRQTHIEDQDGVYDEVILPGAFKRSLSKVVRDENSDIVGGRVPPLMFDHGRHPMFGKLPIGQVQQLHEDHKGLFVRARLFNNPIITWLRDAIAAQAIDGMSFRFEIPAGGGVWRSTKDGRLRAVKEATLFELGPVVFPAYKDTSVMVRSIEHALDEWRERDMQDGGEEEVIANIPLQASTPGVQGLVENAIERLWGLDDFTSDCHVLEYDQKNGTLVFTVLGSRNSDYPGSWIANYSSDPNGGITLASVQQVGAYAPIQSEPSPVQPDNTGYVANAPRSADDATGTRDVGTSDGPADSGTPSEPAAETDGTPERPSMTDTNEREAFLRQIEMTRRGIKKP